MGPTEPEKLRVVHYGVDHALDQVVRLETFKQVHPEWRVIYDNDFKVWRALRLADGSEDNLTRYDLRTMLDALDRLCGQ
jgi:hypothetical protein